MFKFILKTSYALKEKNYRSILFSGVPNLILNIHNLHYKYAWSVGQSSCKSGLVWVGEGEHTKLSFYFSTRECKNDCSETMRLSCSRG